MKKVITIAALCVSASALSACGTVESGQVGLWNEWGKISDNVAGPGVHGYWPIGTSLETMDIKSQPLAGKSAAYTKDLQTANISYTVVLSLNAGQAVHMRTTVGLNWRDQLVPPIAESLIKDVFGQFNANESVGKRPEMQARMLNALRTELAKRGIVVENFVITNIDYSDAFEQAVERAQVATQNAIAAQNHTVEVTEQGKQTVIKANADAESIRVQANAISANPGIIRLKWVEKWDGTMPATVYCSSGTPCIASGGGD